MACRSLSLCLLVLGLSVPVGCSKTVSGQQSDGGDGDGDGDGDDSMGGSGADTSTGGEAGAAGGNVGTGGRDPTEGCEAGLADCDGTAFNACEVDITSSQDHCGSCDDPCDGTCANSTCTEFDVLAEGVTSAPTVRGMALHADTLYWLGNDTLDPNGDTWYAKTIPKAGGTVTTLAQGLGYLNLLYLDDSGTAYFKDYDRTGYSSVPGGATTPLETYCYDLWGDGTDIIWIENYNGAVHVKERAIVSVTDTLIYERTYDPNLVQYSGSHLVVVGGTAYFAETSDGDYDIVETAGDTVVFSGTGIKHLRYREGALFVVDAEDDAFAVREWSDPSLVDVVTDDEIVDFDVSGDYVFYSYGSGSNGGLRRVHRTTGDVIDVLEERGAYSLVVDATHIYFYDPRDSRVLRLEKPPE